MIRRGKKPTVYAFIDSQNLNLGVQRNGWKLDWRKFRQYLEESYGVTKAYLFIGYLVENESLYEHMHELGYLVVLKPTVDVKMHAPPAEDDKSTNTDVLVLKVEDEKPELKERSMIKGNVDTEIVLYAMKELPNYQKAIIVSGDGDFATLAEYLEEKHKLGNILTPNWQYSTLLKQFEPKIVRLDQLRKQLAYHDRKKK